MDDTGELPDPDRPPAEVRHPLLWRMAAQLMIDHRAQSIVPPWLTEPACRGCGRRWPCHGYRLGQRGLRASKRPPAKRAVPNQWPASRRRSERP